MAIPAAALTVVVAHNAASAHREETLGQEAHGASSQKMQAQTDVRPRQQPLAPTTFTWMQAAQSKATQATPTKAASARAPDVLPQPSRQSNIVLDQFNQPISISQG
ncbi:hypothetical protein DVH24_023845 [Malus domestica]|uniref:Uncharacterized protein n=1 Tax=Malus domestica TaxID=3750 RepID=A0A498JLG2_MALDO|nr:hypothetical protein DVH24_023845 [Malus domestica]